MATNLIKSIGWNPFFIEGINEIGKISFFEDGKILATIEKGWFSNGNNDFDKIILPFEIKERRKENLNRKEAFSLSYRDYSGEKSHLYINISLLKNFKIERKVFEYKTKTENVYKDLLTFDVLGVKDVLYRYEDGSKDWKKKQGVFNVKVSVNYLFENNDFGKYVASIQNKAKEVKINLSSYDIQDLLKVLNITIK